MSDVKICPYCAEEIKASAIKCRYCSEFLDGHSPNNTTHAKFTETPSGYTGFCRVCSTNSTFRVVETSFGEASASVFGHFFTNGAQQTFGKIFRSFKEGDFIGKEIQCETCKAKAIICGSCRVYQNNDVNPYCTVCNGYLGE